MSWNQFHKNDPVTYDDNICNFGRVFYHDIASDNVQIIVRTDGESIKGWKIIRRNAKDIRRTVPLAHRWTLEDVFHIPKEIKVRNTSPVPEPNDYMKTITSTLYEDMPRTNIDVRNNGMLSKLFDMLRFT